MDEIKLAMVVKWVQVSAARAKSFAVLSLQYIDSSLDYE